MIDKRWIANPPLDAEQQILSDELAKTINVNPFLASLLVHRGIDSYDHAKDFFRPDLAKLHDPFLMKDMDLAVDRLISAMKNGEKNSCLRRL